MTLATRSGLILADLATVGGLARVDLATVGGLGSLPVDNGIPTPTRYWAFDGSLYDAMGDWYMSPDQGAIEYVTDGAVYGQAARSQLTGSAWIGLAYSDYGSPSRAVAAAWLRHGSYNVGGLWGDETAGVRTLVVRESSTLLTPIQLFTLRIGNEEGTKAGQADEIALWLDPPEYWTVEAAQASLYNGGLGVVWRSGRWWRVAA